MYLDIILGAVGMWVVAAFFVLREGGREFRDTL